MGSKQHSRMQLGDLQGTNSQLNSTFVFWADTFFTLELITQGMSSTETGGPSCRLVYGILLQLPTQTARYQRICNLSAPHMLGLNCAASTFFTFFDCGV